MTAKQIKMAATLYEMRDTARRLLGDKYAAMCATYGEILQDKATSGKKTPLEIAIAICNKPDTLAMQTIFIMAAAVELIEPSNDKKASNA